MDWIFRTGMQEEERIRIYDIQPPTGIPGGDVTIFCEGLRPLNLEEDGLHFCGGICKIEGASAHKLVTRIPENPGSSDVYIAQNGEIRSNVYHFQSPSCIAHTLHIVGRPLVTPDGDVYATFSGTKGQLIPTSVFRITRDGTKEPFISGLMNPTSLATGPDGRIYISSRYDGAVYVADPDGSYEVFSRGLGEAFGLAFDSRGGLYVGDRTGTVFRVTPEGESSFFADLPPSPIAYHLAVGQDDTLYVTVPLEIGENTVYAITPDGEVGELFTDLSEFHGLDVDTEGRLLIAEVCQGKGGVIRFDPATGTRTRLLSGDDIVCPVLGPDGDLYVATFSKLYLIPSDFIED